MAATYSLTLAEEDLEARDVSVTSLRVARVARLWVTIPVASLVLLGMACWHPRSHVKSEAVLDLFEVKTTSLGPVPLKLRVSGVDCGVSGYQKLLNGNYTYQGKAASGRAFYKSEQAQEAPRTLGGLTPWFLNPLGEVKGFFNGPERHHTYLYYTGNSSNSQLYGEWYFIYSNHTDGKFMARLLVTRKGTVMDLNAAPGPAEALPPRRATWNVLCDTTAPNNSVWILHDMKFRAGGKKIETNITGHWTFLNMVMEGTTILTEGQMGSRSYGGSTSTEGGVNLAGNLGDPDRLGASLGFHYDQELSRSWELTRAHSAERSVQIRFPRNGALFVWMQSVKEATLGTHLASYNSLEYAITANIVQKPRCCPAYALDFPAYQTCVPGHELPPFNPSSPDVYCPDLS